MESLLETGPIFARLSIERDYQIHNFIMYSFYGVKRWSSQHVLWLSVRTSDIMNLMVVAWCKEVFKKDSFSIRVEQQYIIGFRRVTVRILDNRGLTRKYQLHSIPDRFIITFWREGEYSLEVECASGKFGLPNDIFSDEILPAYQRSFTKYSSA